MSHAFFVKLNTNTETLTEENVIKPEYLRSENPYVKKNRRKPVKPVYLDPLDEDDLLDELFDYYYYDYDFIPSMKNLERYYRDYYRNQNKVRIMKKKNSIQQKKERRRKQQNKKEKRRRPQMREKKRKSNLIGKFDFYDYYDDFDYDLYSVAERLPSDVENVLNKVRNKSRTRTTTTTTAPTTSTTVYSFQLSPELLSNQIFNQMLKEKNFENFFRDHKKFQDYTENRFKTSAQGNEPPTLRNNVFRPTTKPSSRTRERNNVKHQVLIFSTKIHNECSKKLVYFTTENICKMVWLFSTVVVIFGS